MARIQVLQNAPCETLGIIAQVLQSYGLEPVCVHTYAGEPVPRHLKGMAGLIVLGGPMGVYEVNRYPFLGDAMRLIEQALKRECPFLGICLGSQMLATVLGATVRQGRKKEIGWHPVELTGEAHADPCWQGIPHSFMAFHWHGDLFDLPARATHLASSALTSCQAFVHQGRAYGILFHLEVTEKLIGDMVSAFAGELRREGLDGQEILDPIPLYLHPLQQVGRSVFQNWAALCLEAADR